MPGPILKVGDLVTIKDLDEAATVRQIDVDLRPGRHPYYIVEPDKVPGAMLTFRREHLIKKRLNFRKHGVQ